MRVHLSKIKLKETENPWKLFEQLATVENVYNTETQKIPEDDLIAVVIEKAPKLYSLVLTAEQRIRGSALKLAHFYKL